MVSKCLICKVSFGENPKRSFHREMEDVYKKNKGNAGLDGIQFQISLLTVFLLNALRKLKGWRISTENEDAGKFDDVVLELSDGSAVLLQAKHKDNKRINKDQLLFDNSKSADFSLSKYFLSYQEIKNKFNILNNNIVICTNAEVDKNQLQDILTHHRVTSDHILHHECEAYSFITFNENVLSDLKENAELYYDKNVKGKGVDKGVITDENMKHFLQKLQFFSNYPSGENLNKVIDKLLSGGMHLPLWRGITSEEIYRKVEDWFKVTRGEYLNEPRAIAMFCEIRSNRYCNKLKGYNVSFTRNIFTFTGQKRIFHVTNNGLCLIQTIKIYQSLRDQENKILLINPNDGIQVQKHAVEAFRMSRYVFLVLIGLKVANQSELKALSAALKEILNNFKYKKVILVTENGQNVAEDIGTENDILRVDGSVTFDELSQDSQGRLVKKNNIIFQGDKVSLKALIHESVVQHLSKGLDAELLERLVKGENIKVGTAPTGLDEDTSVYYIERMFEREIFETEPSISLERSLELPALDFKKATTSATLQKANLLLSYLSSEEVPISNEKVSSPDSEIVEKHEETTNKEKRREMLTEKSIFDVNDKVILISDSAGTGKSTVLAKLALVIKKKYPHMWIIRIELNSFSRFLMESIRKKKKTINIVEMLNANSATKLTNALEKFVFTVKEKVVIMLDGFDEICPDYTNLIISLASQCQEASNVTKLIVTTRPHMSGELEALLQVKPFVLQPFTKQDQVTFLTSYWMHNLEVQSEYRDKCEKYCDSLINSISLWIQGGSNFIAIPLQVKMLAEIFQENIRWSESTDWEGCKEFLNGKGEEPILPERMNVTKLYDMFIKKKLDIFTDKANPSGAVVANHVLKSLFDEYFMYHQNIALAVILKGADKRYYELFSHYQYNEMMEPNMLQIGIVQKVGGTLDFVHRTFAEYFVAKCVLEVSELNGQSINRDVDFQQFFIDEILCNPQFAVIRAFLESSLEDVVDSLPCHIFDNYRRCAKSYLKPWKYRSKLIHILAGEGCVSILRLILKCINFEIIRDKQVAVLDQNEDENDKDNTLDCFQRLVEQGGINLKDKSGGNPLHYAAYAHSTMTKFLVEQGADVNVKDMEGWAPMHSAAEKGQLHIISFLEENGADACVQNDDGATPMHFAAAEGHLNVVKYFAGRGIDICIVDNDGNMPLHSAANRCHLDVMELFLDLGVDVDVAANDGTTPLHLAARQSDLKAVELLVQRGADANVKDSKRRTSMHYSARLGYLDIVKFLANRMEDANSQDLEGVTALHFAAVGGHLKIVEFLVGRGVNVDTVTDKGLVAIHAAAAVGHTATVAFLAQHGNVNTRSNDGMTAMHAAAANGHTATVAFLAQHGNVNIRSNDGRTVLHAAAMQGHLDTVQFLVGHGADVTVTFSGGVTAVMAAAKSGHLDVIEYLVDHGVDIGTVGDDGSNALHYAARNGHVHIVKFLVGRGLVINLRDGEGFTALDVAAQNGHMEVVTFFMEHDSDINIRDPTSLHTIVANGHLDIVKYLMGRIEHPGDRRKYGAMFMESAAHCDNLEAIEFLLDSGVNVNHGDGDRFTALHIAADRGNMKAVKYLVEHSANLYVKIKSVTPLHLAAFNGDLNVVAYLAERQKNLDITNVHGDTPLMLAAIRGHSDAVKILLENSANVSFENGEGSVALHSAAQNGHTAVIDVLVRHGADVDVQNKMGNTPMYVAAFRGHLDAVMCLVKHGANPNLSNNSNYFPLLAAAGAGHKDIVELLSKFTDINVRQGEGITALYEAASRGNYPVVEFLVGRGANVEYRDINGCTPLHAAALSGNLDTVKFLASYIDVNTSCFSGSTPLHLAAFFGHLDAVMFLVAQGADFMARNHTGQLPLHLAISEGHVEIVNFFMERVLEKQ